MAISLKEQAELAVNPDFLKQIQQTVGTIALEVLNEDPADLPGGNEEYSYRLTLARQVLKNAPEVAKFKAYVLATKATGTDPFGITDSNYLAFVRQEWSALAGYNHLYQPGA